METLFLSPGIQTGPFERYVQELCSMYVSAQLKEIAKGDPLVQMDKREKFLTKREAASLIGKGEKMIDNYRKKGLPVHMFGRTPMFLESELISFMESYNHKSLKD
ncbi:hypothetical protein [uncultured Duncaniella sp.]|uniref:helix-turn-helix transcriptional regulator n=2 Tax=uncultured Duncaniella sp. TaxID=2768039 RepID=UPI0025B6EC71|nr:hypothetical protein [uncultured Duncaniella sp.]